MNRHDSPELLHRGKRSGRDGLGFSGGLRRAGPVWTKEIKADRLNVFTDLIGGEIVSAKGSGDEALWIEVSNLFAQSFEFVVRNETGIPNIVFIGQVQVPVAMRVQNRDKGVDGPLMGGKVWQEAGRSRNGCRFAACQSDIDDEPAPIAFDDQRQQTFQKRLSWIAVFIDGGDIVRFGIPGRPDAERVESTILEIVQIAHDELHRGAQCSKITELEQEGWLIIDEEMGAGNAECGEGLGLPWSIAFKVGFGFVPELGFRLGFRGVGGKQEVLREESQGGGDREDKSLSGLLHIENLCLRKPKRQRTGAVQNLGRAYSFRWVCPPRLDCACPLALWRVCGSRSRELATAILHLARFVVWGKSPIYPF